MRTKIYCWYCSVGLLALSVVPFLNLMLNITVVNVMIVFVWLGVSAALYIVATKRITFDKGYTAIDAIDFYKGCLKENISIKSLEKDRKRLQIIANKKDYAKDLQLTDLYELYCIGCDLLKQKGYKL